MALFIRTTAPNHIEAVNERDIPCDNSQDAYERFDHHCAMARQHAEYGSVALVQVTALGETVIMEWNPSGVGSNNSSGPIVAWRYLDAKGHWAYVDVEKCLDPDKGPKVITAKQALSAANKGNG